jgi:hypothetical protein
VSEDLLWPDDDDDDEGIPAWLLDSTPPQVPAWPGMWNCWLGGSDHNPADSQAAQACAAVYPGISTLARSCQYFTARAVRYLAFEAGIRQFLEIGTGLPASDPVHEIAAPGSRVIYTTSDPEVLAHARTLPAGAPGVETRCIHGALDNPDDLISQALDALNPCRPAAVLLMQQLGHFDNPATRGGSTFAKVIVRGLTRLLPAGSYLAISEITTCDPALTTALAAYSQAADLPYHPRDPAQVTDLFDGLRLIDPGVVPISQWRPDPSPFTPPPVPAWGSALPDDHQPIAPEISGGCTRAVLAPATVQRENSGPGDNNRHTLKAGIVTQTDFADLSHEHVLPACPQCLFTAVPWRSAGVCCPVLLAWPAGGARQVTCARLPARLPGLTSRGGRRRLGRAPP